MIVHIFLRYGLHIAPIASIRLADETSLAITRTLKKKIIQKGEIEKGIRPSSNKQG
jgi:hypothetical protein